MAVTAEGHAWTCGSNNYGQLGVSDTANRLGFTQVDAGHLEDARIVMAACGWNHSVVVSAEGRVWTFGLGDRGRLGHNDEQDRLVPTLLAAEVFEGSKIVTVAAGGAHNMAVGVNGRLWTWGWGSFGQLGLGDTNNRQVPKLVGAEEVFGGSKVRTVACCNVYTRGGDGVERAVGVGTRSTRSTGPQRRATQAGADARGPEALCPLTHLRRYLFLRPLGSRDR
jgi:alpha-tubulin suppressor-like RCC1 family protein